MSTEEMAGGKTPKAPHIMAIAGIIFAILLSTSLVLIRIAMPATVNGVFGGTERITTSRLLITGLNLLLFAGITFLWFIGVVRDYIGDREDRFFATVLLGSGLLFIGLLFVAAAVAGSVIKNMTSGPRSVVDVQFFIFGHTLSYLIAYVYAVRMAGVFMISTTTLTMNVKLIPQWLAYLGFLFAIVLLLGISRFEWIILLFPFWVLIFSIFILLKEPQR